jgi:hypothetical protein
VNAEVTRIEGGGAVQRRSGSDQISTLCHRWGRLIEVERAYKTFLNREVLVGTQYTCPSAFFVTQTTQTLLVIYYSFLYSLLDSKGVNFVTVTEAIHTELTPEAREAREKAVELWKRIEKQMMILRHKIGFHGEDNYKGLELGYDQFRVINPILPELIMWYLAAFFRFIHLHYDVKGRMINPPTEESARWLLNAAKEREADSAELLALDPRELAGDVFERLQQAAAKRMRLGDSS